MRGYIMRVTDFSIGSGNSIPHLAMGDFNQDLTRSAGAPRICRIGHLPTTAKVESRVCKSHRMGSTSGERFIRLTGACRSEHRADIIVGWICFDLSEPTTNGLKVADLTSADQRRCQELLQPR